METKNKVLLGHGSGGRLSHDLIGKIVLPRLNGRAPLLMDDSAHLHLGGGLAFTTDSYVVSPIFFPGGDIGRLSVCGTVNDLSMAGAVPLYLSLSLILEEGFPLTDLERVLDSVRQAAEEAGVQVVTGDTKVVGRGAADGIFITTSGVGAIPEGVNISGANAVPGDKIILSGTIGDHGIAVMTTKEGLQFSVPVPSDCAPLNSLVANMLLSSNRIHTLRDPTRGGLATTLNEIANQSSVDLEIDESSLPVRDGVRAACEFLGLDPLYIANEGKLVAFVDAADADVVLGAMKRHRYGADAAIIGQVSGAGKGQVTMRTRLGTRRIIDMLTGELLPRIC